MKRLLLLQTRYENLEELFQGRHCQVLAAVIVDGHLLDFGILFDELSLLGLEGDFSIAFPLFRCH